MRKFTISIFAATISTALLVATATPGFAQAYYACWGTGNVSDTPLLEKTNGLMDMRCQSPHQDRRMRAKQFPANRLMLIRAVT
jgi:hypothetical protein